MKLSAVVLAGGQSLRMGKDKSFLIYEDRSFLGRILEELAHVDEVLLSLGQGVHNQEYYQFSNVSLVEDEIDGIGPIVGLYSSLKRCRNEHLFVCTVDMPLFKKELIELLQSFVGPDVDAVIIQASDGFHPLCGIYRKSLLTAIEEMLKEKNYRLMNLLKKSRTRYVSLENGPDEGLITNVNTREEYEKLQGGVALA